MHHQNHCLIDLLIHYHLVDLNLIFHFIALGFVPNLNLQYLDYQTITHPFNRYVHYANHSFFLLILLIQCPTDLVINSIVTIMNLCLTPLIQ